MSTTASERAATTIAWWPWLLPLTATALVAAGLAQALVTGPDLAENVEAVVNLPFAIGFSAVAAAIWASRPATAGLRRLGALYTVVGLGSALVLPVQSWWRAAEQVGLPGEAFARWLGEWVWALGAAPLLALGLLLYPDGRLPGRRWWPAALAGIVAVAGLVGSNAVRGLGVGDERWWAAVGGVAFVLLLASAAAGFVAVLLRFRRAPRGSELRGQISAFVLAGALVALVAALPDGNTTTHLVLTLATGIALPATVANAVVRHRLLDTPAELAARLDAVTTSRRALVTEREEERVRLRRELHDGLGPSLAAIGLGLRQLQRDVEVEQQPVVTLMADEVQRAVVEVRRICEGLRPEALQELGLVPAITAAAERLSALGGPCVVVHADELPRLSPAQEVAAYRVVMEAATNAVRHARADRIDVRLAWDGGLVAEVEDDGVGLPLDPSPGVGLSAMVERADALGGATTLHRGADRGTVVRLRLPESP